jgi:DNA mismatch endonuclease (patch repair protein)
VGAVRSRSEQMSLVRSRDTKPELRVRTYLHAQGLRYRLHDKKLPGNPDLVFPSQRLVVFVHGCFWHRHPGCAAARLPKTRLEFWRTKLEGNVCRDERQQQELSRLGWKVRVIWECETNSQQQLEQLAREIRAIPMKKA